MALIRRNEPTVYAQIDMSTKNPRFPLHPQLSITSQAHTLHHPRGGIPVLPTSTIQTLSPPLQNSFHHRSNNLHPAYLTTPRQHNMQQQTSAHQHLNDDNMHITAETPLINPRESTV